MNKIEQELYLAIDVSEEYNGGEISINKNNATNNCYSLLEKHCIGFTEWLAKNGIKPDGVSKQGDLYWMKYIKASHLNQGTTEQLFKLYIEQL